MLTKEELLAKAKKPAQDAMQLHPFYKGKVQVMSKCTVRDFNDFAIWYTPGVAAPCRAIQAEPELVYEHTNKANCIAVVSDGTRVLGLGDIGPEAGLPVMEGKALLFKYLGGVDAVPICLDTKDPDEFIQTVKLLQPSFGGINLEDISQPKCFKILDALRAEMDIPVWHDDQQGTATVLLAGLINALKIVGKEMGKNQRSPWWAWERPMWPPTACSRPAELTWEGSWPAIARALCTLAAATSRSGKRSSLTSGGFAARPTRSRSWEVSLRPCAEPT